MPLVKNYSDNINVFQLDEIPKDYHLQIYNLITNNFFNSLFGYNGGRNICLDYVQDGTMTSFTQQLYEIFVCCAEQIYGPLKLLETNKKTCWANLSNTNFYLANIHNHERTATVNGVYYFNMPSNCGGELDFYNNNQEIIQTFVPEQSQLIIFPGSLYHKNRYCNSNDFRISINLEILCDLNFNK